MKNYNDPQDWDEENETNNNFDEASERWDYLKDAFGDDAKTVY